MPATLASTDGDGASRGCSGTATPCASGPASLRLQRVVVSDTSSTAPLSLRRPTGSTFTWRLAQLGHFMPKVNLLRLRSKFCPQAPQPGSKKKTSCLSARSLTYVLRKDVSCRSLATGRPRSALSRDKASRPWRCRPHTVARASTVRRPQERVECGRALRRRTRRDATRVTFPIHRCSLHFFTL
jgi:hypothetical protein